MRSIVIAELTREMENQGFSIIPEQTWRAKLSQEELSTLELEQDSTVIQLAEQVEADIALIGSIQVEGQDVILRIRGYDVRDSRLVFNKEERESKNIGIYNKVRSITIELIDALVGWVESQPAKVALPQSETSALEAEPNERSSQELISPQAEGVLESETRQMEAPIPEEVGLAEEEMKTESVVLEQPPEREEVKIRVTLLSKDEGAQVYLGPDQRIGTIKDGKLLIEVPANTRLAIETKKSGYHPNRQYLELADQSVEIRLDPLFKETRFGFELFYTLSQFLGVGAGFRLYVVPDYILFRADDYVYFSVSSEGDDSPAAFHNDFRIQFGSYLFTPPTRRVRFGVATGVGIILSVLGESKTQPETSTYFDLYWDVIDLWLDINWNKSAVFLRVETKLALSIGTSLLDPGLLTNYGPQFTVGWLRKF